MRYSYLIAILIISISCKKQIDEQEVKPSIKNITEFVYASSNVIPRDKYFCRSIRSGIIEKVFINEGDVVKKGQSLFSIRASADVKNRLNNATVNLEESKENLSGTNNKLKSIEVELQRAKDQLSIDSINYQRRKKLWDQKIGSQNELDRSLLSYNTSTNRVEAIKIEYEQARLTLKNNLEKAQNLVSTERDLLGDLVVRSKIDGKIFKIFKQVGELINTQENFAEIGSTEDFIVEMYIDEVDISKITLGDTAIIHLEAYPDTVYISTLSQISAMKDLSTQTFTAESVFVNPPSKLFNGLSGEANIMVDKRKEALIIPSDYLYNGNIVLTNNGETKVKVGVKSLEYIEILSGVDTSTVLLKPDN